MGRNPHVARHTRLDRSERRQTVYSGYLPFPVHSVKSTAAVDRQCRAGDKGRLRAGEEQNSLRDLHRHDDGLSRPCWKFVRLAGGESRIRTLGPREGNYALRPLGQIS